MLDFTGEHIVSCRPMLIGASLERRFERASYLPVLDPTRGSEFSISVNSGPDGEKFTW